LVLTLGAREQRTRLGAKGHWLMRLKFAEGGSHRAVKLCSGTSTSNNFTQMPRLLACCARVALSSANSKVGLENRIADDWLFTCCVPHIRMRFSNDRRLCEIFALSMLCACCDPTLRGCLTEHQCTLIAASLNGVEHTDNCVERVPSENPINGKTLHKGHIARIMAICNRMFMAKQQKKSHTPSKETSNAPPQCPRHQIKA